VRTDKQVKWDFVQQWLDKARQDLEGARILLQSNIKNYESVGFHAQQAVEKLIKAFLVRHQIEFPKNGKAWHDLTQSSKAPMIFMEL
jgi:HEPN domain-containing protein